MQPIDAHLILTNHQLIFAKKFRSYVDYSTNLFLGLIHRIEKIDLSEKYYLDLFCKDLRSIRISFGPINSNPNLTPPSPNRGNVEGLSNNNLNNNINNNNLINNINNDGRLQRDRFYNQLIDRAFPRFFHEIFAFYYKPNSNNNLNNNNNNNNNNIINNNNNNENNNLNNNLINNNK